MTKDILDLKQTLEENGAFEKRPMATIFKFISMFLVTGLLIFLLIRLNHFWCFVLISPFAAWTLMVSIFLGHEAGHGATFSSGMSNKLFYYIAFPLVSGLSALHWANKHNYLHHKSPNVINEDVDIHLWPFATGRHDYDHASKPRKWLQKHLQKYIFWPLIALVAIRLRIRSIIYLFSPTALKKIKLNWIADVGCLMIHYCLWLAIPMLFYPAADVLLFYVYLWAWVGLFVGFIFLLGHTGSPVVEAYDNLHQLQFIVSKNVKLPRFLSWCFVGLDYQIEHHLFPQMSHFNMRKAAPLVKKFAKKKGLPYTEDFLLASLLSVIHYMNNAWQAPVIKVGKPSIKRDII